MSKDTNNSLNLNIEFQNLGKINQATIKLRPFTVIAGCNGSGKSFITKLLYGLFVSSSVPDIRTIISNLINYVAKDIDLLCNSFTDYGAGTLDELAQKSLRLTHIASLNQKKINKLEILEILDEIRETLATLKLEETKNSNNESNFLTEGIFADIFGQSISSINTSIKDNIKELIAFISAPEEKINKVISDKITVCIADNFMVSSLEELISFGAKSTKIHSASVGEVFINGSEIDIDNSSIRNINNLNVHPPIYLESPVYWKIAGALENSKEDLHDTARKRNLEENQLVSQVPKYFFDLMELLEVQVKTNEFSDVVRTIENAINGNLSFSDGNIQFNDKDSNASVGLNLTALGVTNLGMIALLLKRGAILPGTFLFIDEPEVHLHPSWQVVLIQVLHELSKRGVNVVIASHSIDIMKTIENIMDTDDSIDPQAHFGINQLTKEGNSVDESDNNYKRLAAIKEDLGRPFFEMFVDSLGA